MKNLITATAMTLFLLIVMGWQMDLRDMLHQKQTLQYVAQEAAAAIAIDMAGDMPAIDWEQARQAAEARVREQLAGPGTGTEPVTAEAAFDRKGQGSRPAVVVTVRQGRLSAAGWYPVPAAEKHEAIGE